MITLPVDFNALLNLIATQAFIASLLSLLVQHVPFIQNPSVANWKKALFVVVVCVAWVLLSTIIQTGTLPSTPNGWYSLLLVLVAVIFDNQVAYNIVNTAIPGLGDWLLQLFGKQTTASFTIETAAAAPLKPYQAPPIIVTAADIESAKG